MTHPKGTTPQSEKEYTRDQQFFSELESVLDEYFPKVEREGEEKRLMKRGDALMIFAEANRIHSRLLSVARQEAREKAFKEAIYTAETCEVECSLHHQGYNHPTCVECADCDGENIVMRKIVSELRKKAEGKI